MAIHFEQTPIPVTRTVESSLAGLGHIYESTPGAPFHSIKHEESESQSAALAFPLLSLF